MKRSQSARVKTTSIVGKLGKLIGTPKASFSTHHMVIRDAEMIDVNMNFSIRGAWESGDGVINIHITVDDWVPKDMDIPPRMLEDLVTTTLNTELGGLKGTTWSLSIDRDSLDALRRGKIMEKYWQHIIQPIKRGDIRETDAAEALAEILLELRPELKDALASHGAVKCGDGMVSIEGRGLPCPLCLGHLSEEVVSGLFHRLRFERMFEEDDDENERK